jgi:uncharacterized protein YcfL
MVDSADGCGWRLGWLRVAGVALGLVACGGGGSSGAAADASSCTALEPGDAVTLDADVRVLASDDVWSDGAGSLKQAVLASGGEVYWYDRSGSVFVQRQDERVVELRHVERSPLGESAFGLAANSERLYVSYAYGGTSDTGTPAYEGPARLLSISKQDGQATSLLDYADGWLAPITANDERVIVFAVSRQEPGFYQVPLDQPRLEALPLGTASSSADGNATSDRDRVLALWDLFERGQLVGDQVYWVSTYVAPFGLLRSGFDDAEPELLRPMPSSLSLIGPGYVVTAKSAIDSGYHNLGLDFVVTDDSGCRSVQGPRGEQLGAVALDAKYAYWAGYRASASGATFEQTLNRVALDTGAVARLLASGLSDRYLQFSAQDDTHLFLSSNGALLSLRKP